MLITQVWHLLTYLPIMRIVFHFPSFPCWKNHVKFWIFSTQITLLLRYFVTHKFCYCKNHFCVKCETNNTNHLRKCESKWWKLETHAISVELWSQSLDISRIHTILTNNPWTMSNLWWIVENHVAQENRWIGRGKSFQNFCKILILFLRWVEPWVLSFMFAKLCNWVHTIWWTSPFFDNACGLCSLWL